MHSVTMTVAYRETALNSQSRCINTILLSVLLLYAPLKILRSVFNAEKKKRPQNA